MKYRNLSLFLLFVLVNSAQAMDDKLAEDKKNSEQNEKTGRTFLNYYTRHKPKLDSDLKGETFVIPTLSLVGTHLTDLNGFDNLEEVEKLQHLILYSNRLTTASLAPLYKASAIRLLDLSHNRLTDIPSCIYFLPSLTELRLDHNKFTTFDGDFALWSQQLKILRLSHNELHSIPDHMSDLRRLQELHLENNQLASIPASIGRLYWLRQLWLNNNQLTSIPESIGGLSISGDLDTLYIYNNPIPLGQEQLRMRLKLPLDFTLVFKSPQQERAEHDLFQAIREHDVITARRRFNYILVGAVRGPYDRKFKNFIRIDVTKIRDSNGNNLLHAAIDGLVAQLQPVQKKLTEIISSAHLTQAQKWAQSGLLEDHVDALNYRYMKIFRILLSCDEECVNEMLFTPSERDQQVVDAIFARLGPESPIYKAVLEGLMPEKALAAEESTDAEDMEDLGEENIRWHEEVG